MSKPYSLNIWLPDGAEVWIAAEGSEGIRGRKKGNCPDLVSQQEPFPCTPTIPILSIQGDPEV
jgi:hypothetical protein